MTLNLNIGTQSFRMTLWVMSDAPSYQVPNPCVCIRMHTKDHVCTRPCQSLVDYRNMKITGMHLYPQRWNVAAQVAEELKMVTYATPPMEESRKKELKEIPSLVAYSFVVRKISSEQNNAIRMDRQKPPIIKRLKR